MQGTISLSFEREPYFFDAARVEGRNHVTLLSRNEEDKIVAIGSRSSRPYWVEGKLQQLGYLSQLRLVNEHRASPHRLMPGFEKMHEVHSEYKDVKYYIVTVLEENDKARRFLTSGSKKLPTHKEWSRLNTFVFQLVYKKIQNNGYFINRATQAEIPILVKLLQNVYSDKSLAPFWDEESLFGVNSGLKPEDFFIGYNKSTNEPVACVAVWDQRSYKQVYVHDYEKKIKMFRPLLNLVRKWTKYPYFPQVGQAFSHAYLSHLAIAKNHDQVIIPLIQTAINENLSRGFHYLSLGLLQSSPYCDLIKKHYNPYTLRSVVYLAYWPEDEAELSVLPKVDAHLEIAIL